MNDPIYHVIVVPDPHVPMHDEAATESVLSYIRDHYWDEWICLGDLNDFEFLYKLDKTYLKTIEEHTFAHQYAKSAEWLDAMQDAVRRRNKKAKFTLIEGNHDVRADAFMEVNTETSGLLSPEVRLDYNKRGITYIKQWSIGEVYHIGKAGFIHGHSVNKYHASKAVMEFGTNIFYGHTHDIQSFSYTKLGDNSTIVGESLGCLCRYDMKYMRGKPSKWQQAVTSFHFQSNGHFNHFISRIFNGEFIAPSGKLYQPTNGKKIVDLGFLKLGYNKK